MTAAKNPLNAPASESIEKEKLSISKLGAAGATFRLSSNDPKVHIGSFWIRQANEQKIEEQSTKKSEVSFTISKAVIETWLGLQLFAQCNAIQNGDVITSPKTLFTVVA
jgi:hypothetical protein